MKLNAHQKRELLDNDQQADCAQHALDYGRGKHRAQAGEFESRQDELNAACKADRNKQQRVSLGQVAVAQTVIDASKIGARPAAGPLTVTKEPPKNGKMNPAMIAEIMPVIGGAPEATAIPSENGSEINETTIPARMSCRQCFRPAMPFCGFSCAGLVSWVTSGAVEVACIGSPRNGLAGD